MNTEIKLYTFDLDENIFFCWEKIYLYDTLEQKEISISQELYSQYVNNDRYHFIDHDIEKSMRNFRKWKWYLKDQLLKTYKEWKIWPSFDTFIKALNNECYICILTARWHSLVEFEKAFLALIKQFQKDWLVKAWIQIHLTYQPVSNRWFCKKMWIDWYQSASLKKALCFKQFLRDSYEKIVQHSLEQWKNIPFISIWFSDDSTWNIKKMKEYIEENHEKSEIQQWIEYNLLDSSSQQIINQKFLWNIL